MARQVLENGVILPAEYSDDWYDDMTSNLTKLDDVIGSDSEKLSSADVGAAALSNNYNDLDNLPTIPTVNDGTLTIQKNGVDVQTFTANASSNVTANITVPTKTSDITNDSNFVDTSNSAVSSGITSAKVTDYDTHIADTDIHVTTADKNKWNNNTYVFRYSSTALVASSTNSNTLLDNTDNLKVGDKVIDSSGVLFSITAIDSVNSTFTVGSALVDLALDANVVHTSGNETIGGAKTFSSDITLQGTTTPVIKTISNIVQDTSAYNGSVSWVIRDKDNLNNILESALYKYSSKSIDWQLKLIGIHNGVSNTKGIRFTFDPVNGVASFIPIGNNSTSLGNSSTKWNSVYATEYYYGSNNVEFSTKFVTTDTAQTISGQKLFNDINAISSSSEIGVSGGNNSFKVLDKNQKILARIDGGTLSTGMAYSQWLVNNGTDVFNGVSLYQPSANLVQLRPYSSTLNVQLGASNWYFTDCYTSKINGVEPSSLSLPVAPSSTSYVDISSYITVLDSSSANTYTPPSNGYITFNVTGNLVQIFHAYGLQGKWSVQAGNANRGFIPVLGGVEVNIYVNASNIDKFWFIPCQGNV